MKENRHRCHFALWVLAFGCGINCVQLAYYVGELRKRIDALERHLPAPTTPAPDQAAERDRTERIERVGK